MKRGIRLIQECSGNPHELIPKLVNQVGQHETARQLKVSPFTINRWLRDNGYEKRIQYVRKEGA